MGRRSKSDLYDLTDRILLLYTRDKLTIQEIADKLQSENYAISRESVRRSLKNTKEIAADIRKYTDEARAVMEVVRDNPNTDLMEAITTRYAGLMMREVQEIDEVNLEDPSEASLVIGRLANAQAKLGNLRMKYRNGFDDAKKEVMEALKTELTNHPDILKKLSDIVGSLEPKKT